MKTNTPFQQRLQETRELLTRLNDLEIIYRNVIGNFCEHAWNALRLPLKSEITKTEAAAYRESEETS